MDQLKQLKKFTKIVADTGEINQIKKFKPLDATTNPSLILNATRLKEYSHLVKDAIEYSKKQKNLTKKQHIEEAMDKLYVNFGIEILKIIPGRVSTEIDARLSFDTDATVKRARKIIQLYEKSGVKKERVLIKIASTWEGVKAAEILEKEGIHCNLTLLFSLEQAIICAEAGVTLISPFVGRILDWYKAAKGVSGYESDKDPGVVSVKSIYDYYKKFDYKTVVMGASFRNIGEITELAGIDLLTISPQLLDELSSKNDKIVQKLSVDESKKKELKKVTYDEKSFRWALNENAMATEKLAEGIRKFGADIDTLEKELSKSFD